MRSKQEKRDAILWCLRRSPSGMYATELCKITGLWRITIYIHLGRMDEDGLVAMVRDHGPYPQRYKYHFVGVRS